MRAYWIAAASTALMTWNHDSLSAFVGAALTAAVVANLKGHWPASEPLPRSREALPCPRPNGGDCQ
jgi:hypothetical protein